MKGKKTEVVDDPEIERLKKNTQIQSNVAYHGEVDKKEHMDKIRPMNSDHQSMCQTETSSQGKSM